jgi:hypothetical protein
LGFCTPFNIKDANIVCEYYISEDGGIMFIYKLYISHPNLKSCTSSRINSLNRSDYLVMFACFFFTGKIGYDTNSYMKIYEDFDFNKIKKHDV